MTCNLSGPVLRDTARLSQRYPPVARYGVFGVSTWPIGCDTPSPFSERFPLGEHAKWRCDTPPQKGYLSDTCAIPYEKKAHGCNTPLRDTISEGYCTIWGGVSQTGQLSMQQVGLQEDEEEEMVEEGLPEGEYEQHELYHDHHEGAPEIGEMEIGLETCTHILFSGAYQKKPLERLMLFVMRSAGSIHHVMQSFSTTTSWKRPETLTSHMTSRAFKSKHLWHRVM